MRIELKHKQNCPSSRQLRHCLEEIIAEERLPLSVEMIEADGMEEPLVFIGADQIGARQEGRFDKHHLEARQFLDTLRDALLEKWHDHAISPLLHLQEK